MSHSNQVTFFLNCVGITCITIGTTSRSVRPFQWICRLAVISAKNHKRQRRKRQSETTKREKSQTPKVLTAILTLLNLT